MIIRATPLAYALTTVMGCALFLGILTGRAELFVVALPLAIALLSGAWRQQAPRFAVRQTVSVDRLSEGQQVTVSVALLAERPIPVVETLVALPPLLALAAGGGNNRTVLTAAARREAGWSFAIVCPARGRFDIGTVLVRAWDLSGLSVIEERRVLPRSLLVYPDVPAIRHLPKPVRTQRSFGNYVSPLLGEGIEPDEVRPFVAGDRTRRINWRASLRRRQLYVTQFQEERNADIILLLDALTDIGVRPYSTLDSCVRATAALAKGYLARKDRVGFVEFGAFLRWIDPATGRRQAEVLMEGLLPSATHFSYVVPRLDRLPRRILPRDSLVIAVTPLLDERFVGAVNDLVAREFDVVVLAISPVEAVRRVLTHSFADEIACRLWAAEWRSRGDALRLRGIAVCEWDADQPLEAALASFTATRRHSAARA